jgi:hypothetical protein
MSFTDPGVTGAFRASWRKGNPRVVLQEILNERPKAGRDEILKLFREEVKADEDLMDGVILYWFDNNWRSLSPETKAGGPGAKPGGTAARASVTPPTVTAKTIPSSAKHKIKERIVYETKLMLLELVMPNGKRLADCTGPECQSFGSWFAELAAQAPKDKTIGEAFSEDQVRALWRAAKR